MSAGPNEMGVDQLPPTPKRKWHRAFWWIGGIIVVLLAIFFISPQVFAVPLFKTQFSQSKYPGLYIASQQRMINPENFAGTPYSYFGLSLSEPWGQPTQLTDKSQDLGLVQIKFPKDHFILFENPRLETNAVQAFTASTTPKDITKIKSLLGADIVSSNYNLYKDVFAINLNNLSPFSDSKTMVSDLILSTLRLTIMGVPELTANSKIYSFNTGKIQGIQLGDPSIDKTIFLHIFDVTGENHHLITLSGTQDEVDYILNSIVLSSSTQN